MKKLLSVVAVLAVLVGGRAFADVLKSITFNGGSASGLLDGGAASDPITLRGGVTCTIPGLPGAAFGNVIVVQQVSNDGNNYVTVTSDAGTNYASLFDAGAVVGTVALQLSGQPFLDTRIKAIGTLPAGGTISCTIDGTN